MQGATIWHYSTVLYRFFLGSICPPCPPQPYHRRWIVYLRSKPIGAVLAATHDAACARPIHRFKISMEDQKELKVRGRAAD